MRGGVIGLTLLALYSWVSSLSYLHNHCFLTQFFGRIWVVETFLCSFPQYNVYCSVSSSSIILVCFLLLITSIFQILVQDIVECEKDVQTHTLSLSFTQDKIFYRIDLCHQAVDEDEEDDENNFQESLLVKTFSERSSLNAENSRRCFPFRLVHIRSRQRIVILVQILWNDSF